MIEELKPYKKLGEGVNVKGFYPEFTCSSCEKTFYGHYVKSPRGGGSWHSCSSCANVVVIDFERSTFCVYYLDKEAYSYEEITRIVLQNLKSCLCGGKFEYETTAKCPFCFNELDEDMLLTYHYIQQNGEQAFQSLEVKHKYEESVKEKAAKDNLFYRHGVETAVEYYKEGGALKPPTQDQREKLRQTCLPMATDKIFFADQWLVEQPKRNLYELYMTKFFEPPKDKQPKSVILHTQYSIAHIIASFAGDPFEKEMVNYDKIRSPEIEKLFAQHPDELKHLTEAFAKKDYRTWLEQAKKIDLFKVQEKALQEVQTKIAKMEEPWIVKAEKEIKKWQGWWKKNRDKLPT